MSETVVAALDCGHEPIVAEGGVGTGYAIDESGRKICYACADSAHAAQMSGSDQTFAYVSSGGENITTWTGGVLARVVSHTKSRNGFYGSWIHYWRARDADGNIWYGRNAGEGMAVKLRRAVTR